jgi:hypothetical protein
MQTLNVKSSFRDPDNQVFITDQGLYRLIRESAIPDYKTLMQSGLYDRLVAKKLIVSHQDVTDDFSMMPGKGANDAVIRPQIIPFISYPYEWCFSALKAAALTTLEIQRLAMDYGMTLKDASAFNIQFLDGKWVLIDTGSFRIQKETHPWGAYRQFCQHFLAPLLLMAYCDERLLTLTSRYSDGIPLDLATKLLPIHAKCRLSVFIHLVCHSRFLLKDFNADAVEQQKKKISKASAYGMLDQLSSLIRSLEVKMVGSAWTAYEDTHTYATNEYKEKESFILNCVDRIDICKIWDLGANTGHFSRLISTQIKKDLSIVAFDYDFMTVESGYRKSSRLTQNHPLHIWMDLLNPSPSLGWAGEEWQDLKNRGPADIVLALALIHHLCLSGNLSFPQVFDYFKDISRYLIIEFVPKSDPQSQRLLKSRQDIYIKYTQDYFEKEMQRYYRILNIKVISKTGRTLYFLQNISRVTHD